MVCRQKGIGICQRTMIFQKHCVIILQIFGNRIGNFIGGRRAVFSDRHAAQRDNRFRHNGLCQRNTRDRKAGSIQGMSMHYRLYIRSFFIYPHMHLNLGRGLKTFVRLDHFAFRIHLADIFRRHKSLAHTSRRAKKFVVVQFHGKVTVIGCHHAPVVNSPANFTHFFLNFILIQHNSLILLRFICKILVFCCLFFHNTTKNNISQLVFVWNMIQK